MRFSLCDGWEYTREWSESFLNGGGEAQSVRLPHTCAETALHCVDPSGYETVCGYRRSLTLPPELRGGRVFLQFDGAAHCAEVFVNGRSVIVHRCGYTPFRVELTQEDLSGARVDIAVRLDTSENPEIPPFGFVLDYLAYGGLYREVWLDVRGKTLIDDIFVRTPSLDTAQISVSTDGGAEGQPLRVRIKDSDGETVWENTAPLAARTEELTACVPNARVWDTETPALYTCEAALLDGNGTPADSDSRVFGFRTAEFRADGFYLNGKKTFLRGLNRHQSYPYVGYAVPESLQREDARILREELSCVAVRTSHYPQSPWFMDECDRRGLLVFTEFPGWQHIGDEAWKQQALTNLREMIIRDRSRPSAILWGVRINESLDDDGFYERTNALAHELDPSRQTSGVRYLEKSSLLEDVYAYNDFSHDGKTPGAKRKKDVTPDMGKALLISECNGHMYPTKPFDDWAHRQEQALRHIRVQDAAAGSGEHAGCFGWCMFDYQTHKDFGSGDRICYHGVMDSFRNPKLAAAAYASQGGSRTVLEVGSSMDIGDYAAGKPGEVYVFTNADEVALYKNDVFVTKLARSGYKSLPHPPFIADDFIGDMLETQDGYPPKQARLLRECLLAAGRHGLANLPLADKLKLLWCMVRYHMTFDDGVALYGKYVGGWGGAATRWRFDAIKDGTVVASVTKSPSARLRLEALPSHTRLVERASYDMAAVRVRVLDENGSAVPYAQLPVSFEARGDIELVGPDVVTAEGGMCGTYLRSVGREGSGNLTVKAPGLESAVIEFTVQIQKDGVIK